MAYCTECGTFVLDSDRFCPRCGRAQQAGAGEAAAGSGRPPPPPPAASSTMPGATPPPPRPVPAAALSIQPNIAAMLCYLPGLGWVAAIIFLALDPYRTHRYVRFHAFQGLYLAVLWLLAHVFFFPFHPHGWPFLPFASARGLLKVAVLIAQIVGIVKTVKNQEYRVPILAELADKSMA